MQNGPIRYLREKVAASYWFLPSVLTLGAVALAITSVTLDVRIGSRDFDWPWPIDPAGARTVLSTVAASIMTVTGVVFSITIVVLTLASSQFGPRLVRSFMYDRATQFALGTFLATFVYCLLVLCTVHRAEGEPFTPRISVSCAIALILLDVGVLIFFIDHMAVAIQAPTVIAKVSEELTRTIDELFPRERAGSPAGKPAGDLEPRGHDEGSLAAPRTGYVQNVDVQRIVRLASERGLVVKLSARPGQFVAEGRTLAAAIPAMRVDEQVQRTLRASILIGRHRSMTQDCEFAVDQIVEIALRALSPGVNDPHTALICIDHVGAAVARAAGRPMPLAVHADGEGVPRLYIPPLTFEGLLDAAFSEIRQHGLGNVAVTLRLIETLGRVADATRDRERHEAILGHVRRVQAALEVGDFVAADRVAISERLERVLG